MVWVCSKDKFEFARIAERSGETPGRKNSMETLKYVLCMENIHQCGWKLGYSGRGKPGVRREIVEIRFHAGDCPLASCFIFK